MSLFAVRQKNFFFFFFNMKTVCTSVNKPRLVHLYGFFRDINWSRHILVTDHSSVRLLLSKCLRLIEAEINISRSLLLSYNQPCYFLCYQIIYEHYSNFTQKYYHRVSKFPQSFTTAVRRKPIYVLA